MTGKRKRKLAMPDTLIIVASVVLLVAILSWIIPSGPTITGNEHQGKIRNVAIDGTYHTIDKSEVTTTGFLGFFSVLYRGCVEAADVIFMILCCCGTFGVVVKTGAFHAGIGTILKKLKGKEILLVPIIMMIFGLGGSVFGMASEFYGFYPLIVGLGVALGYDAMFGFAIIAVGEFVGYGRDTESIFCRNCPDNFRCRALFRNRIPCDLLRDLHGNFHYLCNGLRAEN